MVGANLSALNGLPAYSDTNEAWSTGYQSTEACSLPLRRLDKHPICWHTGATCNIIHHLLRSDLDPVQLDLVSERGEHS